jgi:hypothetical protein
MKWKRNGRWTITIKCKMELNKFKYPESDANVVEDFYREIWHENDTIDTLKLILVIM